MGKKNDTILSCPDFLRELVVHEHRLVCIDQLYVGLISLDGSHIYYVPIIETPHYVFARHILKEEPMRCAHKYQSYSHYRAIHPQKHSVDVFKHLMITIKDKGYEWKVSPIFVFRHWRRPFPVDRWDVADGFHRLAILAALGEKKIQVTILRRKQNLLTRLKSRVFR